MNIFNKLSTGVMALALSAISLSAHANYVTNGSFENTNGVNDSFSINNPTALPGWTATPSGNHLLDCLIYNGDTTNLCGTAFGGGFTFWVNPGASPDGGNRVGMDGDRPFASALTQTINGLTAGKQYHLTFWQAAAQQRTLNGATTEKWEVKLGSESYFSTVMNTPNHGTSAWNKQYMMFTATASSEVLSFFAAGTPAGAPPFALVDGISLIPEPATYTMLGMGLLSMILANRRKNRHA